MNSRNPQITDGWFRIWVGFFPKAFLLCVYVAGCINKKNIVIRATTLFVKGNEELLHMTWKDMKYLRWMSKVEWIMWAHLVFFYLFRHLENREGESVQGGIWPHAITPLSHTHAHRGAMLGVVSFWHIISISIPSSPESRGWLTSSPTDTNHTAQQRL